MNSVLLKVSGSLPGKLAFDLDCNGERHQAETTWEFSVEALNTDPSALAQILPTSIRGELVQWIVGRAEPGLLAIVSAESALDGIPWEHLPQVLGLTTVSVVRLLDHAAAIPAVPAGDPLRLLAAGWSGRPTLNLPGIQQEIEALSQIGAQTDVSVRVLMDPSYDRFAGAYDSFQPNLLHLVPPALGHSNVMPDMILSGKDDLEYIPLDKFLSPLSSDFCPYLVVLNSCSSGEGGDWLAATRVLTERLGAVSVGWLGEVNDLAAVDFARFFYTRLLEGSTILDVLRSYGRLQASANTSGVGTRDLRVALRNPDFTAVPAVWTPSLEAVTRSLGLKSDEVERARPREARPRGGPPRYGPRPSQPASEPLAPTVEMTFEPQKWLNPAMLKNGDPAIKRLVLNPDQEIPSVEMSITCDTGNGISTVRQTRTLSRGPQPITDIFQFPALYALIEAAVPRRQINFTVTCSQSGALLAEETRSVLWMGLTEWLDSKETWHFIPAFVDPYANGVLQVIGDADGKLKNLDAPTSAFSGYQRGDREFVKKQVEAIFNCLRDDPYELRYINPPPLPVFTPGDKYARGQRVRTPDAMIENKWGTCHDLAVLFASCLEYVGICPLIILISGHTFAGFWTDGEAHGEFWERARQDTLRLAQVAGREWIITDLDELLRLEQKGQVCFLEATDVTNRNARFSDAIKQGLNNLMTLQPPFSRFDVAVDIQASRGRIQPLRG